MLPCNQAKLCMLPYAWVGVQMFTHTKLPLCKSVFGGHEPVKQAQLNSSSLPTLPQMEACLLSLVTLFPFTIEETNGWQGISMQFKFLTDLHYFSLP